MKLDFEDAPEWMTGIGTMKVVKNDPSVHRTSESIPMTDEEKQAMSVAVKAAWQDPERVARHSALCKANANTPEAKARRAEINRARWAQPGAREAMSIKMKAIRAAQKATKKSGP